MKKEINNELKEKIVKKFDNVIDKLEKLPKQIIPMTNDLIQGEKDKAINDIPEIRVWCHPHFIGKSGDDYYNIFDNFLDALTFITENEEAEKQPLIAFRGKEINIFELEKTK